MNALVPDNSHAVLDAIDAVGDLREVVLAERLLVRVEHAVVGAGELEIAVRQQVHQEAWCAWVVAQRRRHHVAGCVSPALVEAVSAVCTETSSDRLTYHHYSTSARVRYLNSFNNPEINNPACNLYFLRQPPIV